MRADLAPRPCRGAVWVNLGRHFRLISLWFVGTEWGSPGRCLCPLRARPPPFSQSRVDIMGRATQRCSFSPAPQGGPT